MQAGRVFADAKRVAFEFDGRVGEDIGNALFGAAKPETRDANIAVHMEFVVGAADDGDVAGDVAEFEADGAGDVEGAVKAAGDGGAHLAAGEGYREREHRDGCGEL